MTMVLHLSTLQAIFQFSRRTSSLLNDFDMWGGGFNSWPEALWRRSSLQVQGGLGTGGCIAQFAGFVGFGARGSVARGALGVTGQRPSGGAVHCRYGGLCVFVGSRAQQHEVLQVCSLSM
jgi:hypothetical protein